MLYLDIPTLGDIKRLSSVRGDICVSIYLPTTPITQDVQAARIELKNLVKDALQQAAEALTDKRRLAALQEQFDDIAEDDAFWRYQAHSLAILATPDAVRTFRLANRLSQIVEVSDRYHLKPLIRAVTFPQAAYVLALSENAVRLVEISADIPPTVVRLPDLPKDAASAVGKSTINDRSHSRRIHGSEGQKVRLAQYVRQVDAAIRPVVGGNDLPLILAAAQPLDAIFRSVSNLDVLPDTISGSPDRTSDADLAAAARPMLDTAYRRQIEAFYETFETRTGQGRATGDIAAGARAAQFGNIDQMLVDMDAVVSGTVDEETGAVTFTEEAGAESYGVINEIAGRALATGANVLAVRAEDVPGGKPLAAILRAAI